MIVGSVAVGGREATVDLTVQGRADAQRVVRAVIDTGFNGWLTMPPDLVRELALSLPNVDPIPAQGRTN